jgi:hypothetical protein
MEKLVPLQNSGLQLSIDGMKPNKAGGGGGVKVHDVGGSSSTLMSLKVMMKNLTQLLI